MWWLALLGLAPILLITLIARDLDRTLDGYGGPPDTDTEHDQPAQAGFFTPGEPE